MVNGEILKFFLNGPTWGNESYKKILVSMRTHWDRHELVEGERVGKDEWRRTSPSISLSSSRKQRRRRFQLSESRRTQLNWRLEPPGVRVFNTVSRSSSRRLSKIWLQVREDIRKIVQLWDFFSKTILCRIGITPFFGGVTKWWKFAEKNSFVGLDLIIILLTLSPILS
jgi:hypothetical protein